MKKALLLAPMGSVHRRFNKANIEALKDLGYEVHLLANFSDGDGAESKNSIFAKNCEENGIKIHSIPFSRHSLLKNIKYVKSIKNLFKEEEFEIIHAHTETGGLLLRMSYKSAKKSCNFYYTPHGMSFYKGSSFKSRIIYKPIEKWICKKMDCTLPINLEEKFWLDKWKCKNAFVHGIGLDLTRFFDAKFSKHYLQQKCDIPTNKYSVVSVGELDSNKNHKVVIEAISKIPFKKDINYLICGVGPMERDLRDYAKSLDVNLYLTGFRYDIPEILAQCNLFVFPSFHEGLAVSLLEAMAAGVPVVASKIRGNTDLIENDSNGCIVEGNSVDEYSIKIKELLEEENLRTRYAIKSKEIVEKYSFDNVRKELYKVYAK